MSVTTAGPSAHPGVFLFSVGLVSCGLAVAAFGVEVLGIVPATIAATVGATHFTKREVVLVRPQRDDKGTP